MCLAPILGFPLHAVPSLRPATRGSGAVIVVALPILWQCRGHTVEAEADPVERQTCLRTTVPRPFVLTTLMRPIHPHKCHLCGWIERIPGGTRQNDGLETGIMGATAATLAWSCPARYTKAVWKDASTRTGFGWHWDHTYWGGAPKYSLWVTALGSQQMR